MPSDPSKWLAITAPQIIFQKAIGHGSWWHSSVNKSSGASSSPFTKDLMASGLEEGKEAWRDYCQPKQASAFRKGDAIVLQSHPCRLIEYSTSKTGKHGHAKCKFTGLDIFTGTKHMELQGASHSMLTFVLTKTEWMVMDIADQQVSLISSETNETRDDLCLPAHDPALAADLRKAWTAAQSAASDVVVTVLTAVGRSEIVAVTSRPAAT